MYTLHSSTSLKRLHISLKATTSVPDFCRTLFNRLVLLNNVYKLIKKQGYRLINASICIMAERPKLSPYIDQMKQNIAYVLHTTKEHIGITCTTLEGLGIVGREEGIACRAYCLVEKER